MKKRVKIIQIFSTNFIAYMFSNIIKHWISSNSFTIIEKILNDRQGSTIIRSAIDLVVRSDHESIRSWSPIFSDRPAISNLHVQTSKENEKLIDFEKNRYIFTIIITIEQVMWDGSYMPLTPCNDKSFSSNTLKMNFSVY